MATPESAASPEASARKQNSLDAAERRRRLRKSSQQQYLYMDSMASHMMVDDDDDDDTAEEDNNDEEANHHENNTKTVENNEDEKEKMEEEDHESNNNTRKEVHSSASDVCHPKERREIETELPKRTRMIRRSSKMDETEANISLKEDFAGRKKKSTVRFAPETMKSTVAANSENKQHAQEEEGACQQQEEKTDGLAAAQKETTHRSAARASRSRPNRTDGPPRRETQHLVAAAAKKEEEELPFNECPAAALPNKQDEDEDEFCFDLRNDGTDERNDPWLGAAVFGSEEEAMLAAASSTHQQQQNDDDDRQLEKRRHNGTDERFVPGLGSALCLEEGIATEDEEIKLNQVCEEEKDELFDSSDEEGYCEDHISQQDNRSAKRPHRATRQMKIQEDNKKHIQQQETSGKLLVQYSSSFCARHKGRMGYGSPIPYRKAIASTLPLFLKGDNLQRTTIIESLMNRFEFYDSKSKSMLDARSAYHKIQRAFFRKMGSATFFDTSASNETPVRSSRKRSRKENVLYTQDEVKSHEDEEAPTSTRKRQRVSPPPQRVDSKAPSSSEKLVVRHQRGGRHDQYGNVDFMRHVKLKSMEYKSAMEELSRDAIVDEFMARYDIQSKKANTGQWTTLEATLAREKIAKTLLKQSGYSKQLAKVTDSPSTERSNDKPKLRNKEAVNKLLPQIKESKFKKGDRRTKSSSGKLAKTRLKDSCYIKKFSTLTYSSSKKNSKDKSTLRSTATVENRLSQLGVSDNEDNRPTTSNSGKQIVYCGHGSSLKHYPGNIAFVSFVHTHRAEYLHFKEERDRLIDEAFGTFEFRKDWEVADPIWAKSKLHKALIEARRKPPRFSCDNAPGVATEQQPSKYLHTFRNEDTPYIEELAYHHYAGLNPTDRVSQPIPKPKPVPKPFSDSTTVKWTYNETTRVYLVDFSNVEHVSTGHKQFLGELMERDDITVICEGLLGGMPVVSTDELLNELADSFRKDPYHRFRRFQKTIGDDGFVTFVELDHFVSMKVSDFVTYLAMLQGKGGDSSVVVYDPTGKPHTITASEAFDIVFYMVDVDMPKWLFTLNEEYKNKFKIKEILPGGAWCLMNYLPEQTRPFMGPNCYITPGGGFTQIHQDGHGTVDSGHSNLSGYNEVVMLRRLPECHKQNACVTMPSLSNSSSGDRAHNMLYRLPHDDGRKDELVWPTNKTVDAWTKMNYCPSVFILKEGQHVLINKGRLHAFRKMTVDALPDADCHAVARRQLLETLNYPTRLPVCISIAFDWMYMGSTAEGINREAATSIECGALCRDKNCKSLSIPETAILRLASRIPAAGRGDQQRMIIKRSGLDDSQLRCCWDDISRGILPSLRHVVNREWAVHRAPNAAGKITVDEPDSAIDPSSTPVDPFGNDYFCRLCDSELANTYYHCEGCEQLLSKDFNTCLRCFTETKFLTNVKMNEGYVMHAKHNHVGNPRKKCECNEMCTNVCPHCSRLSCCCSCHTRLTKHYRFFPPDDLLEILKKLEERVGENEIVFSEETTNRLGLTPMTQTAQCAGDNQRCRQYEMEGADSISQEGADLHLMDRELLDSSLSNEVFDSDTEDHRGTDDLNNFKVRSIASPDGPADCRQDSTAVQIPPQRTESIIAKLIQSSTLEGKLKPSSASFVEGASVDFCDDVAHKQSSLTKLVEDDGENDKSEKNTNHLEQTTMTQAKQCSGVKQYNMEGANSISQTSIDPSIPVQLHDGELLDASYRRNGLFDSDSDDRRCSDDSNDATFIASPDEPADCRQDLTEVQGTVINLCGSFVHDKSAIDDVACVPKVFQDNFDSSPARFIMNPATSMSDGKRTSIYRGDGQEHDRRVDTIKDVQYKKGPIPTFVEDMEVFPLPTVNRE